MVAIQAKFLFQCLFFLRNVFTFLLQLGFFLWKSFQVDAVWSNFKVCNKISSSSSLKSKLIFFEREEQKKPQPTLSFLMLEKNWSTCNVTCSIELSFCPLSLSSSYLRISFELPPYIIIISSSSYIEYHLHSERPKSSCNQKGAWRYKVPSLGLTCLIHYYKCNY